MIYGKKKLPFLNVNPINHSNVSNNDPNANNNNNDSAVNKEMTLPMFSCINLPKNFLDFVHPPFSEPILESSDIQIFLCLLTGKTVARDSESINGNFHQYETIINLLEDNFNNSFSVLMKLN